MKTGAWFPAAIAAATLTACVVRSTPITTPTTTTPPTPTPTPPPGGRPDQAAVPGVSVNPDAVQAATSTPWTHLPLPAGASPVVITAGPLGGGAFLAGFHEVGGVQRRWIVLASQGGELTAVDAGEGTLGAAAVDGSGRGFLLLGGSGSNWFGRVSAAGRVAAETRLKVDVGADLNEVLPLGDGALIVGVHNPVTSGETNGWVVAVDGAAKVKWEQRIGRGAYHILWRAAIDRRGHLLAVGASKKSGTYQGWLVDLDKDGKLAGEQIIASKTWDLLLGIAVAGDEELYVTGKSSRDQDGDGVALIARRKSLAVETWRHEVLDGVVLVAAPVVHRASVEFLVVTGKGNTGTLHLVRAPRDGGTPVVRPVGTEGFPLDWLMMPGWIIGTTDADTTVAQVRRAADGGVEWRTTRIPRK